ncbi:hypothetical protein AB1L42_07910 [Thalassoglobus sp. JC818]|uniref:hypothetical protein n=1 Tax=Thalassoglobus sp. JC818 TaxID=3232136 RepID=UPI0034595D81
MRRSRWDRPASKLPNSSGGNRFRSGLNGWGRMIVAGVITFVESLEFSMGKTAMTKKIR